MEWFAVVKVEVANVAVPLLRGTAAPSAVEPSMKVTLPVGVAGEVEVTFAVKVTDWPATDGFTEEVSVVVVGAIATT